MQNFFRRDGIAVVRADPRFAARSRRDGRQLWIDVTRSTLYVLLPQISIVYALFLVGEELDPEP